MKTKLQILIAALALVSMAGWLHGQQWPTNNQEGIRSVAGIPPKSTQVYLTNLPPKEWGPLAMYGMVVTNKAVESIDATNAFNALKENGGLTNMVDLIISSGEFCRIRGHRWEPGCGMEGCAVNHEGPTRHCAVCGLMQTQTPGEWK